MIMTEQEVLSVVSDTHEYSEARCAVASAGKLVSSVPEKDGSSSDTIDRKCKHYENTQDVHDMQLKVLLPGRRSASAEEGKPEIKEYETTDGDKQSSSGKIQDSEGDSNSFRKKTIIALVRIISAMGCGHYAQVHE